MPPAEDIVVGHQKIDPLEIEQAICRLPSIKRAAVCARAAAGNEPQLAAYVVLRPQQLSSERSLRRALQASLPSSMIPSRFVFVDNLPVTPEGTIDREALGRPEPSQDTAPPGPLTDQKPRSPTSGVRRSAFQKSVGTTTFSILEATPWPRWTYRSAFDRLLVSSCRLTRSLNIRALVNWLLKSIASASRVRRLVRYSLPRAPRGEPLPLSYFQERIWNFSQTAKGSTAYTFTITQRIDGPIDPNCCGNVRPPW